MAKTDDVRGSFQEWKETQIAALEAIGSELDDMHYDRAATIMERTVRGQAALAVRIRNEANRQAGVS